MRLLLYISRPNADFSRSEWLGQPSGVFRVSEEDHRALPAEGPRPVLARGLPQVLLLRLPPRRGGVDTLHQGQPPPVSQGLPKVTLGSCWLG